MHSHYHRGQNATRLRELGGEPPMTDLIVWYWKGRPVAGLVRMCAAASVPASMVEPASRETRAGERPFHDGDRVRVAGEERRDGTPGSCGCPSPGATRELPSSSVRSSCGVIAKTVVLLRAHGGALRRSKQQVRRRHEFGKIDGHGEAGKTGPDARGGDANVCLSGGESSKSWPTHRDAACTRSHAPTERLAVLREWRPPANPHAAALGHLAA